MKFIDDLANNFGIDKILHFIGGGWIVSLFTPFGWLGLIIGFILMLILSFVKELYLDDSFDKRDIIFGCFGGGVSIVLYVLFRLLFL